MRSATVSVTPMSETAALLIGYARVSTASRSEQMVDLSLRLLHNISDPANFVLYQQKFLYIFS